MNNKNLQTEKKKAAKSKKRLAFNIAGIVICILLLPILIINGTLFVQHILDEDVPPSFLGYTPLVVDTGSMVPEFEAGDLAVVRNVEIEEASELVPGDVICYRTGKVLVTHRIVEIEYTDGGEKMYVTQGDANNIPDTVRVAPSQVLGVYMLHINDLGHFVIFLQSPIGMIVCVVLPLLLIFLAFYLIDRKHMKDLLKENTQASAQTP